MGAGALAETGELPPLHWSLAGSAVRLHVEAGKLPRDYDLRHAGVQTGLTLYNTRHVVVDGFVFQGFQQDGVNAHELVRDCTLRNIECRANGRSGLSVGGSSRVGVENGKFYDNGRVQVRTEGVAKLALTGSDVDRAAGPGYSHGGRSLTVDGAPILQR
ncbi:MAG: right-handed parallel beta-helix repeat-containing protein [Planctomycetota bacterium]